MLLRVPALDYVASIQCLMLKCLRLVHLAPHLLILRALAGGKTIPTSMTYMFQQPNIHESANRALVIVLQDSC